MTDTTSQDDILKVTLLGTGIPNPQINAFGTSTLIEAGDQRVRLERPADLTGEIAEHPQDRLARLETVHLFFHCL